jgi:biotin-dependent carboxylase-like uncharacterized protein
MSGIEVIKPGLMTTVQDLGRPGYYHLGIPMSGAMDRFALRVANLLVGNDEGAAGLEIVFSGPTLKFGSKRTVAVTGAEMPPQLNGRAVPTWSSFTVQAGDTLSFAFLKKGARAYVAISGGIDVPLILGSRSTYPIVGMGGFQGRPLKAGDMVALEAEKGGAKSEIVLPKDLVREISREVSLRVLPGLYDFRVEEGSLQEFFEDSWKVAPEADRMGYRFRGGKPLKFVSREQPFGAGSDPSNIVDAGYPYGSVQVPAGLEPIVLHRDAVTGGGYFMIGTVIASDMDLIGQLQPHQKVRFAKVTMEDALAARASEIARLERARELCR